MIRVDRGIERDLRVAQATVPPRENWYDMIQRLLYRDVRRSKQLISVSLIAEYGKQELIADKTSDTHLRSLYFSPSFSRQSSLV